MILLNEVVHTEFWSYIYNVRKTTLQAHHVFIHCVDKQNMDMNFYDMTLAFVFIPRKNKITYTIIQFQRILFPLYFSL